MYQTQDRHARNIDKNEKKAQGKKTLKVEKSKKNLWTMYKKGKFETGQKAQMLYEIRFMIQEGEQTTWRCIQVTGD